MQPFAIAPSILSANFARLGIHSGMAISYLLPRITSVPRAAELLFTGRVFSGTEAAEMGIANYAVEPGQVLAKSRELAAEIAACAPVASRSSRDGSAPSSATVAASG